MEWSGEELEKGRSEPYVSFGEVEEKERRRGEEWREKEEERGEQ